MIGHVPVSREHRGAVSSNYCKGQFRWSDHSERQRELLATEVTQQLRLGNSWIESYSDLSTVIFVVNVLVPYYFKTS